jgi:type I restriction-modification system DNA methylase subunit
MIYNIFVDTLVRKETLGERLGVSLATVNNWIKTQVIPSPDVQDFYSKSSYNKIIFKLKNDAARLNARANRSMQKKNEMCYLGITDKNRKKLLNELVEKFKSSNLTIDEGVLSLSFALLCSNNLIDINWKIGNQTKIDTLLSSWIEKSSKPEIIRQLYSRYEIHNFNDDILGAFYQSIQSISQKSKIGSYYTPSELLREITVNPDKTVLDPCCGSGGILLNVLSKTHDQSKIYARDVDETALKICFINLVLFFDDINMAANILKQNITCNDITDNIDEQFDFIITNPPWGSKFSKKEKDNFITSYPELQTTEIFSISLYNSVKKLKQEGELFFFLPHSFLNVAAHKNIRNFIFNKDNKIFIKLLGNSFRGVLSENILINICKSSNESDITIQNKSGENCRLPFKNIVPPYYIVSATGNDQDTFLLEKIYNAEHTNLKNDTIFALGIVTGNNKKYLLDKKSEKAEPVYRGKDIEKYKFLKPEYFIEFKPELYQQTAPTEYYCQKKIAYRFICDKLVCVLDKDNALLLNSANLFISKNYPMETIISFFNSDIYTFIYRKKYHSKKILKSHLQNLPLPILSDDTHRYIYNLYEKTFVIGNGGVDDFQSEIDGIICKSFGIDKREYGYMKK